MDEQHYKYILQQAAERSVQDVDLWDSIERQVQHQKKPAQQRKVRYQRTLVMRFGVIVAVLLLMCVTSAVGYAVVQRFLDPGTENVLEQGLQQPVEQSQTIIAPTQEVFPEDEEAVPGEEVGTQQQLEGFTVTIKWAYADANRVLIGYEYEVPEGYFDIPVYQGITPQLSYSDGSFFNHSIAPIGITQTETTESGVLSLGHSEPVPEGGVYDLLLTMRITEFVPDQPLPEVITPEDLVGLSGQTVPIGDLVFPLELSSAPEQIIDVKEVVEVSGVTVRVEQVSLTPAAVNVTYCYEYPSTDTLDWMARTSVEIDGEPALPLGGGLAGSKGDINTVERCWEDEFAAAVNEGQQVLVFTVERIVNPLPEMNPANAPVERIQQAEEALAAEGIIVEFQIGDHGFGYDIISLPEGMSEGEAALRIFDAFSVGLDGPWVFEIPLS